MKQIPLSQGLFALVDDEDFARISKHKWYASLESRGTKWYAVRKVRRQGKTVKIRMHREVMKLGPDPQRLGPVVDHLNHFSLDNRKENLELTTQRANMLRSPKWKRAPGACAKKEHACAFS